jgi:hypothetical protein
MLRSWGRISVRMVVLLVALVTALAVSLAMHSGPSRIDAAQLCLNVPPDAPGLCVPLP